MKERTAQAHLLGVGAFPESSKEPSALKARDPERQKIIGLFAAWDDAHGDTPVKVTDLAEQVRVIADPNDRGRLYLAREVGRLAGTRLAGCVLERQEQNNRVVFSDKSGKQYRLPVSRGTGGGSYVLSRTRSQLRRMGLDDQNNHS